MLVQITKMWLENDFEIVADLLEESGFQIENKDDFLYTKYHS